MSRGQNWRGRAVAPAENCDGLRTVAVAEDLLNVKPTEHPAVLRDGMLRSRHCGSHVRSGATAGSY